MDVEQKLVEIIQNSVGGCARHWAEVIADGLIAHGVTVQEWVSVEERLPEQDGKYIVYTRTGFTGLSYYYALEGAFGFERWDATHWMPLPQPPK